MERPAGYETYATQLLRWDTEELLAAAAKIKGLTADPGWTVLFRLLSEKKQATLDRIVFGPVLDQASYAAQTSLVAGIDASLRAADAVLFAAERRENEEREAVEQREAASG